MNKKILLEEIKRMHELIGITPNILMESEITEAGIVSKEGAELLAKFFTNLERPLVANGKSYTKNQVKQIIGKIGTTQLNNEEKVLVSTLTKEAIALDKTLIKRLSNEIFGEIQKLTNRQLKTKYYSEVKKGLREVLPKEELDKLITNVNAKLNIQPKSTPTPNPNPNPNPAPNPLPSPNPVFVDITDEEFMGIVRQEFANLNVPLKINAKQEKFFISQIKPEINRLYTEIEPVLVTKYKEIHLRYNQIEPSKRKDVIVKAQEALLKQGIGLNIPKRFLHNIGQYLEQSLAENSANGYKKFKLNVGLTILAMGVNYLSSEISKGKGEVKFIFGFSLKQNILFKTLLGILGLFTNGIPSLIIAFGSLITAGVEGALSLRGKDVSELLGMSPMSIEEAKTYVESNENPLQLQFDNGDKVTKYEPIDKNMKAMEGGEGAFIRVYVNDDTEPYTTLKKDLLTKKVKKIDEN
jgi:hypothetical protein